MSYKLKKRNSLDSFLRGMARALDLNGSISKPRQKYRSANDAIKSDWQRIGQDFYRTAKRFEKQLNAR